MQHDGTVLTRMKGSADGLTPYERLKGKSSETPTAHRGIQRAMQTGDVESEVPISHSQVHGRHLEHGERNCSTHRGIRSEHRVREDDKRETRFFF